MRQSFQTKIWRHVKSGGTATMALAPPGIAEGVYAFSHEVDVVFRVLFPKHYQTPEEAEADIGAAYDTRAIAEACLRGEGLPEGVHADPPKASIHRLILEEVSS